jgi:hypothetical protein
MPKSWRETTLPELIAYWERHNSEYARLLDLVEEIIGKGSGDKYSILSRLLKSGLLVARERDAIQVSLVSAYGWL